mgnify:CR=1 FL=1
MCTQLFDPKVDYIVKNIFGNENHEKIADYLGHLGEIAKPYKLRIEGPVDMEQRVFSFYGYDKR